MALPDRLQKGHTYVDGDVVNAANLNSLVDEATALAGFISELGSASAAGADEALILKAGALKRAAVSTFPGAGTVTSVAWDSGYPQPGTVFTGSVQTGASTAKIRLSLDDKDGNKVLAAPPDGTMGTPSFRALVPADLPVATVNISGLVINWNLGLVFIKQLAIDSTFSFSNASSGQTIRVLLYQNTPGGWFAHWPAGVKWKGGVNPVMTPHGIDIYTFHNIDGNYYGTFDQNFLP